MNFKSKSVLVRCTMLALTLVLSCASGVYAAGNDNQKQSSISPTDSISQPFERYKAFGVIYNTEKDGVYYNGERVKIFVEFMSYSADGIGLAFDLCYIDDSDSTLYLEAVKNSSGKITEIRRLKPEIAKELLAAAEGAYHERDTSPSITPNKEIVPYSLNGTQVFESYGITAKDLTQDKVEQNIKDWINQCDKKQGAYILSTQTLGQYVTYIYYNTAGPYPWNMSVDGGKIKVNLYSNSKSTPKEGYSLICITAPKKYTDISLFLDNTQLDLNTGDFLFLIQDQCYTAGGAFKFGDEFALEKDSYIQIATNISVEQGELNLVIQELANGSYYVGNNLYDATGKLMEASYLAMAGNGKAEYDLTTVFLKAGKYSIYLTNNGTVNGSIKNAKWKIVGTLVKNVPTPTE